MTTPQYDERDAGLLMVFSDPGKEATEAEFHDWYDNEHVPLRTKKFTTFLTAARYEVTASSHTSDTDTSPSGAFKAKWSAIYTISSNSLFNEPAYTSLRTNRSAREGELLSRIGVLDRRIYRLVYDSASDGGIDITTDSRGGIGPAPADLRARTAREIEKEAPFVVATSVTPAKGNKAAYDEWYAKEHAGMIAKVPGWHRTRRYELIDAVINGKEVKASNGDASEVPLCLGLHEYTTDTFEDTPEFKAAVSTPWRNQVVAGGLVQRERRLMKLYRAWDAETALKSQQKSE
ncbi:hypothetical protein CBS101457_003188 [Exobasidium rhododendri]|nr:hypothetical protein CBS101457_003188 [Exobasidium rhododendri]